jgi:glycosyltransferase involved in cell wall biosynthesis
VTDSGAGDRRITVLHVLDDLDTGGTERQLAALLRSSDQRLFHHVVCALATGGRFAKEIEQLGIPVYLLHARPSHDYGRSIYRLWRLVRRINPDILHARLFRPGVVSRIVGRLCGRPVLTGLVSTMYEPEWYRDNPRLKRWRVWPWWALDVVTARLWGTFFVAVSESVKLSAMRQMGLSPTSIAVIPRGIPPEAAAGCPGADAAAVRASMGWQDADPLILNVARLVPAKGQRYAILAMKEVAAAHPRARLVIAGEGWLHDDLQALIDAHGLARHVTLLGERNDVPALLRAADIFVFSSICEGFGNALIEAMAAGKPCVVTNIPALREVTGDGRVAVLAEAFSPGSLAASIMRVAANRDLARRLGAQAREWVLTRYAFDQTADALDALYEVLAADPAGIRRRGFVHGPGASARPAVARQRL